MQISYSALSDFKNCPLKYKYKYIDHIKGPKSKDQLFGTWIHEALKITHTPQTMPPTERQVLEHFVSRWDNSVFASEQESQTTLHQGIRILKDYYAKNYPGDFNVINLEMPFLTPLTTASETHIISGRIDRIDKRPDGSFEIIDYKTSKKMPGQKEIDHDLQLAIYNLGIINQWPSLFQEKKVPIYLSLYFLKHGEKLTSQRTPEQLKQTQELLLADIAAIQKENVKPTGFAPRQNPLCDWCEYQRQCPLWRHKFQSAPPPDEPSLQAALAEYLQIKSNELQNKNRLAILQNAINQYCDSHNLDRVFNDQGYVMRAIQKRVAYNPAELRTILKPVGLWSRVLSFDAKKLKPLLTIIPYALRQQIDSAGREKEFKVIRAGFTRK